MRDPTPDSRSVSLGDTTVVLGSRTELMLRAILEHRDEIESGSSDCLELHYGPKDMQARLERKLGFWKVG